MDKRQIKLANIESGKPKKKMGIAKASTAPFVVNV
jgi:hypothetical protein